MKKQAQLPALTPGQAQYVLNRMAQERKINSNQISGYVRDMHREINALEVRLGMLRRAAGASAPAAAPRAAARPKTGRPARAARPRARRAVRPIRKEVKASQQLQGIYLSLIKQLAKDKRPEIQKLCKEQGRQEAIKKMKAILHR